VDSNRAIVDALTANIALLAADNCHAVHSQAEQFLRSTTSSYEIIFLDPPYKQPKLLESALEALSNGGLIGGHIYMEAENNQTLLNLCERFDLQVAKSTSAGSTFSVLARR
jgi:16S rRNA G966 N2-methylase RsmD